MSSVAKFRNNQWFHVEDLHQRRGYHGSITVGDKTMVIGGNYGQPREQTVSTEVFEFFEVTTAPVANMTTSPPSTASTPWDSTENCGNSCRIHHWSETLNSSMAEAQSVVYHGTAMDPKLHWSHATGFGLYEVDSNFCRFETDIIDVPTTTSIITTSNMM